MQGSRPGEDFVDGTEYLQTAFQFSYGHRWRNYGILVAFTMALFITHLVMSEVVASERSKGEVLVFRRSRMKMAKRATTDEESGSASAHDSEKFDDSNSTEHNVQKQDSIFHWEKVKYDIQIKNETRTILNSVDGWIKPGTLTALMVSSSSLTGTGMWLTVFRVFRAPARQPFLTFWQVVRRWA